MKLSFLCVMLGVFICSCGASYTPVVTASGEAGIAVDCIDMSDCLQKAGRACPSGYTKLDESSRESDDIDQLSVAAASVCQTQQAANRNQNMHCENTPVRTMKRTHTTMVVRCGKGTDSDSHFAAEAAPAADDGAAAPAAKAAPSADEIHAGLDRAQEAATAPATEGAAVGPAPDKEEEFSCNLNKKSLRRAYRLTEVKNSGCPLPGGEVVGSDEAWPPNRDHTMGPMQCAIKTDVVIPNNCKRATMWQCVNPNNGFTAIFGVVLKQDKDGTVHGSLDIMNGAVIGGQAAILCEAEYSIKSVK